MGSSSSQDEQLNTQFFADASIESSNLQFELGLDWENLVQDSGADESVNITSSFTARGALDAVSKPAQEIEGGENVDTTSSSFTHQEALDAVNKPAQEMEGGENVNTTLSFPDQNSNSPLTKKRKRSQEDSASSPPTRPARKGRIQHPFQLNLPKQLPTIVVIDGQPHFPAPVPAPAPIPVPVPVPVGPSDSSRTMVAADSFSNSKSSERYLDSNRLRQQVKSGLAETHGINEGDKWECRLPGGTYLVECLRDGLCAMQWFGEVVFV